MENSDEPEAETPEDVAILYSWANLHGAKYRDFSASRREYRAQVRHRAAEEIRVLELKAKAEAEAAAAEAERAAREAERAARAPEEFEGTVDRERALQEADNAARRAAAERVEAARRAEAAALADVVARREEREIAEAHASAQRQAARWADSEVRRRSLAGPQPMAVPGQSGDPYEFTQGSSVDAELYTPNRQIEYTQPTRYGDEYAQRFPDRRSAPLERQAYSGERRSYRPELEVRRRPQGFRPDEASGVRLAYRPTGADATRARINTADDFPRGTPAYLTQVPAVQVAEPQRAPAQVYPAQAYPVQESPEQGRRELYAAGSDRRGDGIVRRPAPSQDGPAWLYTNSPQPPARADDAPAQPTVADTLQHSRERVASRWFALKGVFEPGEEAAAEAAPARQMATRTPVLAVFSIAGGVGKTSMVATLGRTLSSLGEKVLLADMTSHGLLPYYFGATELRPGVVRTFSPPTGSTDAPIYLVSYDVEERMGDRAAEDGIGEELVRSASGTHRAVLDINANSGWVIRRLARVNPTVLVPVAPDMNSVISLQGVEKYFREVVDGEGRPILPYYVLNQFDASLPLHLDVREVLRRQLGDRLLPVVIRRAAAVSEALAEGMTVVDYAPDAGVAEDYMNIATWVRTVSAPVTQGFRNVRWSER